MNPEIGQQFGERSGKRYGAFPASFAVFVPFCGHPSGFAVWFTGFTRLTIRPICGKVLLLCQRHLRNEAEK